MAPSRSAAAAPPFSKDERVLCFHHEMLYEAKVLDSRQQDEKDNHSWQFKIHYKGWKNTVRIHVMFVVLSFSDLGPIWASSSKVGKSEAARRSSLQR
jgi:hypothetical protein